MKNPDKRIFESLQIAKEKSEQELVDCLNAVEQALDVLLKLCPASEVSDKVKGHLVSMSKKLNLDDKKPTQRIRAKQISVAEKIEWLKDQLKGNREGVLKSKLLELYSIQYRCKLNPNCLDLAIEMAGFETQSIEGSKHVMVVKRSRKASE